MRCLSFSEMPEKSELYLFQESIVTKDFIVDQIYSGCKVEILSKEGYNITKEFLFNHCFPTTEMLKNYVSEVFTIEDFEDIIESGGTKNVIERAIRSRR